MAEKAERLRQEVTTYKSFSYWLLVSSKPQSRTFSSFLSQIRRVLYSHFPAHMLRTEVIGQSRERRAYPVDSFISTWFYLRPTIRGTINIPRSYSEVRFPRVFHMRCVGKESVVRVLLMFSHLRTRNCKYNTLRVSDLTKEVKFELKNTYCLFRNSKINLDVNYMVLFVGREPTVYHREN